MNFELYLVTPTDCSSPSVLVTHGTRRVLFNCGDGLQRLCGEKKMKLTRLGDVFFTRLDMDTLGGLGGMMLTLCDKEAGRTPATAASTCCSSSSSSSSSSSRSSGPNITHSLHLYGPKKLANYIHGMRHIYKRPSSKITVTEIYESGEEFTGQDGLTIIPIVTALGKVVESQSMEFKDEREPAMKRSRSNQGYPVGRWFGTLDVRKSPPQVTSPPPNDAAISYVLKAKGKRGKFLPKKAKELGVTPGRDFGKLTKGESVTTPDGKVVKPEDCMDEAEPQQSIMIISCPSLEHVENMIENSAFTQHKQSPGLLFAVHLTPLHVLQDPRYRKWMNEFKKSPDFKHILVNKDVCSNERVFEASANVLDFLATGVDPDIFARDVSGNPTQVCLEDTSPFETLKTLDSETFDENKCVPGKLLHRLVVHPSSLRGIHPPTKLELTKPEFDGKQKSESAPGATAATGTGDDAKIEYEITFLGTGSAIPSKYRNVSSILCRFNTLASENAPAMLLDCGEGSVAQLARRFGKEKATSIVEKDLKLIWISHMHADHHLGVLRILEDRSMDLEPLVIVGPDQFHEFLKDCIEGVPTMQARYHFCEITRSNKKITIHDSDHPLVGKALKSIGVKSLTSIPVIHCFNSYALLVEMEDGRRLAYSGDTRPCPLFVNVCKGASLLIHEATFEEEKMKEAVEKRHSTTLEAITVGNEMGASFTILTHFSQRYPKVSPANLSSAACDDQKNDAMEDEGQKQKTSVSKEGETTKVIVAADLMVVKSTSLDHAASIGERVEQVMEERQEKLDGL